MYKGIMKFHNEWWEKSNSSFFQFRYNSSLLRLRRIAIGIISLIICTTLSIESAWAERLRIVVDNNFPPFAYVENGEVKGTGIEALQAAAKISGIEISFVPVSFNEIERTIKSGEADAIFPLAINPDRKKIYNFSESFLSTGGALFVKEPLKAPVSLSDLKGKTIVTPATGPLVNYIRNNEQTVRVVTTKNYDEAFKLIISGEADAAALNKQVGTILVKKNYAQKISIPTKYFWELSLALAIPKKLKYDLEVLERLNKGLDKLQKNLKEDEQRK